MDILAEKAFIVKKVMFEVKNIIPSDGERDTTTIFLKDSPIVIRLDPKVGSQMGVGRFYKAVCIFDRMRIKHILFMREFSSMDNSACSAATPLIDESAFWTHLSLGTSFGPDRDSD
jgi:hypothetical protein